MCFIRKKERLVYIAFELLPFLILICDRACVCVCVCVCGQNKILERKQAILTEVNYDSDYNGRQYSN